MEPKGRASKLDGHAERLEEWFLAGQTLAQVQEQLRQDGVAVSTGRLSEWWTARRAKLAERQMIQDIVIGAQSRREIQGALEKDPAPGLDEIAALHRVISYKLTTQGTADPETLDLATRLARLAMDHAKAKAEGESREKKLALEAERIEEQRRSGDLAERRVKLLEKRAAQADQVEQVTGANLTPEEQAARIREIFKR